MTPKKFDENKAQLSLIDPQFLMSMAQVLGYGEQKYPASSHWMPGMDWSRMSDAALRHIMAFNMGENVDGETGFSHLVHAACCLMMLNSYYLRYAGKDDRRFTPELPMPKFPMNESELVERIKCWADGVYPDRTAHGAFAKLVLEEIPEIVADPTDPGEWADAYILLVDAAALRGVDILAAASAKMDVNEGRTWKINRETGMMNHE